MVLYGAGAAGVKKIKKGKKGAPKGEAQFKCSLPRDYESMMVKLKNSDFIRCNGLTNLDRHTQNVMTPQDLMYLFHFDMHMTDVSLQEVAGLAITLGCRKGEGHRAIIDYKKLLPQLKKTTSLFREDYHTHRKEEEDETEARKKERASVFAYKGEETIYGPADEDFLAQGLQKIEKAVMEFRRLYTVKFDEMCKKEIHGQLNPGKIRDFFRENLGLKLTRLESIAFVRYGDAFNVGTVPVSFVQEQIRNMSRGICYSMQVPKGGNFDGLDDGTSRGGDMSLGMGSMDSEYTSSMNTNTGQTHATGQSYGMSTLTGGTSASGRILPMAFLHGMNGRRGKRAMKKFYLDAMVPKEQRDKRLEKTLITQLQGIVGPEGGLDDPKKKKKRGEDDYSDDDDDYSFSLDDDHSEAGAGLGGGQDETGGSYFEGESFAPLSLSRDDHSSVGSAITDAITTKSLNTFKSQGSVGSVRYHNDNYRHHLANTKAKVNQNYVPERKSETVLNLQAKVLNDKARARGRGFGGRSVQSIHDAHNKDLVEAKVHGDAELREQTGRSEYAPPDNSPLAGTGSRILVPTTMGHVGRSAVGGSTAILRSKTPMSLIRPMMHTDTTREREIAERVANEARPQDIFRGDLKRYLAAGLTRLPLEAKASKLKFTTRWELLYVLAGNLKLRKVWPGRMLAELRKVGEMRPLEGVSDPNAETGVWIERRQFEAVTTGKMQVLSVRNANVLFSALDPRKRGAIALFELAVQMVPFCGADALVTEGKKDRNTGAFIDRVQDLPRRVVMGVACNEKTKGDDIIDMLLSVVEMEVYYWAKVKYHEDRAIPGESVKERKMRLAAKKRKQMELQALGVEFFDVKAKLMEEKAQLTRGLCEAALTLLASSHTTEVAVLELTEALFGRMAMAESSKRLEFSPKAPEAIMTTPVDREDVMEHVRRSAKLCAAVETEFRSVLYVGKNTVLVKKDDPRLGTDGEGGGEDDDASIGEMSLGSLGSHEATSTVSKATRSSKAGTKKRDKGGKVPKPAGDEAYGLDAPPNDERHVVDH